MFFRSLFYERTVLSLVEKVEELPLHIQAEIATRVSNYINQARTAGDGIPLDRFVEAAVRERERVIARTDKSAIDQWAAPAIAEAWCTAMLGLSNGTLDRHSALAIIVGVESFALKRAASELKPGAPPVSSAL